jgi:hypothetical protein
MRKLLACIVAVAVLGACSSIKPYPNNYNKNVRIITKTDGSFLSSVRTAVDIYRVDNTCNTTYQGTVQLRGPTTLLGFPYDQPVYLMFVFEESSFLTNSRSSITYETMFRPEPDGHYEFDVSYADKIYGVQMRKALADGDGWTNVDSQPLIDC